jgi:hypothetical protein
VSAVRHFAADLAVPASWRGRGRLIAVVALLGGCSDELLDVSVTGVEPDRVSEKVATDVDVVGYGFAAAAQVFLDSDTPPEINRAWHVQLGDQAMVQALQIDEQRLRFTVADTVVAGIYGVRVIAPSGQEFVLDDALTVEELAAAKCQGTYVDICASGEPAPAMVISADTIIDTDSDPRCRVTAQTGGPELCVWYVAAATVAPGVTLTGRGSRPLAIVSDGALVVDGLIDVGSRIGGVSGAGANFAGCPVAAQPEQDLGGSGGGAGGSFAGVGGDGGTGDTDNSAGFDGVAQPGLAAGAVLTPALIRGGCPGNDGGNESATGGVGGAGGAAGGALYLLSGQAITVSSSGAIRAAGAGGGGGQKESGGGGGGSGGSIVLEAPVVTASGGLSANGGGGGGGGAVWVTPLPGSPGSDGELGDTPAVGGAGGGTSGGGSGGAGSAGAVLDGERGGDSLGAGGGGGGGAGVIYVLDAALAGEGIISPPASTP